MLAAAVMVGPAYSGDIREGGSMIVFIDSAVRDAEQLIDGMPEGAIIHRLPDDTSGFDDIAAIASTYRDVGSIHVISHGKPGRLQLGGSQYDAQNLSEKAGQALTTIGKSLSEDGDILLYGCDIAAGPNGQKFVDEVAELTDADVAASDDTTGNVAMGGNWRLEAFSGEVENAIAVSMEARAGWQHILANTTLDWSTRPYTDFTIGSTDAAVVDGVTVTSSGTETGSPVAVDHEIDPARTYSTYSGLIRSSFDATIDDGSVTNTTRFAFSEPVYNLSFTIIDIDGGIAQNFADGIQFASSTGAFPTAAFGSNVTYSAVTGYGASLGGLCNVGGGNVPDCLLTPTFAGPVDWVTVTYIGEDASGSDPTNQLIYITDLTFNTPPDATDNSNSTTESATVAGNMISDDDGSGIDSDRQDANALLSVLSVDGNAVGVGGLVINLASGATLTVQQDGSYTFDPNGGYESLGLGQSAIETFTYIVQDAEGLSNNDGSATDSVATLTITINGEADYDFAVTKVVDVTNVTVFPTTLNYTITVTNTGDTGMTGVNPVDTLTQGASTTGLTLSGPVGDGGTIGTLDPTEVWTYTASHVVTLAQMDNAGDLVNDVDVTTTQMGATVRSASATSTITANPALSVTKIASDTTDVVLNQVITYTYLVENTGNQTITNVTLSDAHNGSGPAPVPGSETLTTDTAPLLDSTDGGVNGTWDSIAPGDIVTFTATYTVTQSDVDTLQ